MLSYCAVQAEQLQEEVCNEVKIPTLSRQKAAGQGWGTLGIEFQLAWNTEPARFAFRIFLCGLMGSFGIPDSLTHW